MTYFTKLDFQIDRVTKTVKNNRSKYSKHNGAELCQAQTQISYVPDVGSIDLYHSTLFEVIYH